MYQRTFPDISYELLNSDTVFLSTVYTVSRILKQRILSSFTLFLYYLGEYAMAPTSMVASIGNFASIHECAGGSFKNTFYILYS